MTPTRALTIAALLLPMSLAAQQPAAVPAPPPPNQITLSYKLAATQYAGWLTAAFDSIPESKYSYRPTPAQLSIGLVAQHLENANYQLCSRFGGVTYTKTAKDSLADSIKAMWPKDTLVARLKASIAYCDAELTKVNDGNLADQLLDGRPGSGMTTSRARYVLIYVTDLVDHWSQIAIYMRLNGMTPPSALPRPAH